MLLKLVETTITIDSFTSFKANDNTYREILHLRSREGHAATRDTSLHNLKHCVPVHLLMMKSNQSEILQVNSTRLFFTEIEWQEKNKQTNKIANWCRNGTINLWRQRQQWRNVQIVNSELKGLYLILRHAKWQR